MNTDERYMQRCLQLARCGQQNAKPNPMVGAVIVASGTSENAPERIIGEGYHVRCGQGHAEVNAFASVRPEDESLLSQATMYVSLEPCSHYGKTPPCADLIISKGIKRVVVGCIDEFAEVQGRGIKKLREAGIDVTVGVLEEECKALNRQFAVKFSFLLSIPAVLGANLLALADAFSEGVDWSSFGPCLVGMLVAMVVGYAAIVLLRYIVRKGRFGYFAYYCGFAGVMTLLLTIILK